MNLLVRWSVENWWQALDSFLVLYSFRKVKVISRFRLSGYQCSCSLSFYFYSYSGCGCLCLCISRTRSFSFSFVFFLYVRVRSFFRFQYQNFGIFEKKNNNETQIPGIAVFLSLPKNIHFLFFKNNNCEQKQKRRPVRH